MEIFPQRRSLFRLIKSFDSEFIQIYLRVATCSLQGRDILTTALAVIYSKALLLSERYAVKDAH